MARRGQMLDRGERQRLFDLCDAGHSEREVVQTLVKEARRQGRRPPDDKTIRRYYAVYQVLTGRLKSSDPTIKNRWDTLGITDRFVDMVKVEVGRRQQEAQAQQAPGPTREDPWRTRHFRRLVHLASQIRRCLYDPRIPLRVELGAGLPRPLEVQGTNWALEPDVWLASVTPDLSAEAPWGKLLPSLREHMAKSPFWRHLEELRQAVADYDRMLLEAARSVAAANPGFAEFWKEVAFAREFEGLPSRTPVTPDDGRSVRPLYDRDAAEWALRLLYEAEPKLIESQWDLVSRLEALHDDLLPDRVERLIAEGTCHLCRERSPG